MTGNRWQMLASWTIAKVWQSVVEPLARLFISRRFFTVDAAIVPIARATAKIPIERRF